jgi:flavin reductase (DIM6/NTAB) family NADH-FMN oxidoreductase RutF
VKPPHVGESAFSMECEVMHWYDMKSDDGNVSGTVIIGRVKRFHVVSLD